MGVRLRKNKKFNYIPRYFDDKGEGSPYQVKHKFDDYRKTIGDNKNLKGKVVAALDELKSSPNNEVNNRVLIIVIILVALFLFIIDFDLSIFFSKN